MLRILSYGPTEGCKAYYKRSMLETGMSKENKKKNETLKTKRRGLKDL